MSNDHQYPCGKCECQEGCDCAGTPVPAAYLVQRDTKVLSVCTLCRHSTDRHLDLLVTRHHDPLPFLEWDMLAFFFLPGEIKEKEEKLTGAKVN